MFAVWEQENGCVFNPDNWMTHRGITSSGFETREDAQKWADENAETLEFINGAGGISTETHFIVVFLHEDGTITCA